MVTTNGSIQNAKLVQEYLKNLAEQEKLWLAVGTGNDLWDNSLPTVIKNTVKLTNECFRVKVNPDDIVLVEVDKTADDDIVTDSGTTIRILGNIVCPMKPLREYGLFIDGTEIADSGILYSYDVHSKIVLGQLNLCLKYVYINF